MEPRIIAFTGTHGVGKTHAAKDLAACLRSEQPRTSTGLLIDMERHCPYPINRQTTEKAQRWIFYHQLAMELDLVASWDRLVADRTVLDVIAYTKVAGFRVLADEMFYAVRRHLAIYRQIHFLTAANHPFHMDDGTRDMDPDFRLRVETELIRLYQAAGITEQQRFTLI